MKIIEVETVNDLPKKPHSFDAYVQRVFGNSPDIIYKSKELHPSACIKVDEMVWDVFFDGTKYTKIRST